jgi:hypothetical protein
MAVIDECTRQPPGLLNFISSSHLGLRSCQGRANSPMQKFPSDFTPRLTARPNQIVCDTKTAYLFFFISSHTPPIYSLSLSLSLYLSLSLSLSTFHLLPFSTSALLSAFIACLLHRSPPLDPPYLYFSSTYLRSTNRRPHVFLAKLAFAESMRHAPIFRSAPRPRVHTTSNIRHE